VPIYSSAIFDLNKSQAIIMNQATQFADASAGGTIMIYAESLGLLKPCKSMVIDTLCRFCNTRMNKSQIPFFEPEARICIVNLPREMLVMHKPIQPLGLPRNRKHQRSWWRRLQDAVGGYIGGNDLNIYVPEARTARIV
jgi:hypothetical protein